MAAGSPEPRYSARSGNPSGEAPIWPSVEPDTNNNAAPFQEITFYINGNNVEAAGQQNRRSRRRYNRAERAQVAETRRLGACDKCRASKLKCYHASQPAAAGQFLMESHEQFALGLTNPSAEENLNGHKQEMKRTIAAIDNKLVGDPEKSTEQDVAKGPAPVHKAEVAAAKSCSKPLAAKRWSTQQQKPPAKVHQAQKSAATSKGPPPGVNKPFKILQHDGRGARQSPRPKRQKTTPSAGQGNIAQNRLDVGLTEPGEPRIVVPQRHPVQIIKPAHPTGINAQLVDIETSCEDMSVMMVGEPGVAATDMWMKGLYGGLGAERTDLLEVMPQWRHRRGSMMSEQESVTLGMEGSVRSLGRTPSPWKGECTTSSPPGFVNPFDLSLDKTSRMFEALAPLDFQNASEPIPHGEVQAQSSSQYILDQSEVSPECMMDLLNHNDDWDEATLISDSTRSQPAN